MSNGELVPQTSPEVIAWKTAQRVAKTEFVPDAYRGRPEAVFAAILYGRELGFGPMQSLQSINVIKGKPSLAPEAMRARVLAAGHTIQTETYGNEQVTLIGVRADTEAEATITWTLDDAKRAGLIKQGGGWTTYPRAMLLARATSELCRLLFPDCISGASYTPEELGGENPVSDDSDVIDVEELSVSTPTETEEGSETAAPPVRAGSATEGLKAPAAVAEPLPIPPSVRADLKRRDVLLFAAKLSPRAEAKRLGLPDIERCSKESQLNEWAHLIEAKEIELAELRAPFNEPERVS